MIKVDLLRDWEFRLYSAEDAIEELEYDLEYQSYEQDVTQRIYEAATDAKAREMWQTQIDVLQGIIIMTEADLAKQQEEVTLCEAMIAAILADLEAEGINPDDYEYGLGDMFPGGDIFPDIDFDPGDDIPF